jgi:DNA-binding transcriptional ArsR family regulator
MDAVAHALADAVRRDIMRMLRDQPVNAGRIAGAFPVSRPAVSRHLRVLREAGLVRDVLRGRERVYQLTLDALSELEAYLAELRAPSRWERRLMALETEVHRVKRERQDPPSALERANDSKKDIA